MSRYTDQFHRRKHDGPRSFLRIAGPLVVVVGLIFTIIGVGSFFSSFGSFEPPRYFWCAFVGIPLMTVGGAMCKFGYLGAVTRYVANEVTPVGKDVVNYITSGTKDAVRDVASAIASGIRDGADDEQQANVRCRQCDTPNDASAKFCDQCGAELINSLSCTSCGQPNDPDARFCDNCGKPMAPTSG